MVKDSILVSSFGNIYLTDRPQNYALIEVLEGFKSKQNPFQHYIQEIRKADHKKANELKLGLPSILFSGTFKMRTDKDLETYSQLICLDIDEVSDPRNLRKEIVGVPYVYSSFLSPSGKGLKVLIFHDCSDPSFHSQIYYMLGNELGLTTRTDLKFDNHCSNISRACYISFDPDLKINSKAQVKEIDINTLPPLSKVKSSKPFSDHDTVIREPINPLPTDFKSLKRMKNALIEDVEQFERFYSFFPGVRNNNLNILAFTLRSKGYPKELVQYFLSLLYGTKYSDFTSSEIERIVNSAYKT